MPDDSQKQPLDRTALFLGVGGVVIINFAILLHFTTSIANYMVVLLLVLGIACALGGLWRFNTGDKTSR